MSQWFECQKGHKVFLEGNSQKLIKKATLRNARGQPLIVCPYCKPENVSLNPCDPDEKTFIDQFAKKFHCKHGHVTTVYPFANGVCNVSCGDTQENIEADPVTMLELIEDGIVKCPHTQANDSACDGKITPIDNTPLEIPKTHGLKTRVRVGDVWDKNHCPEPKASEHKIVKRHGVTDAEFQETEFSRRMKRRAQDKGIWVYDDKAKKQVKIKKRRISKKSGEIITKSTKDSYRDGKSHRPNKGDL